MSTTGLKPALSLHQQRIPFFRYAPEADALRIGKLFHAPSRLETTGNKVHRHKQTGAETPYELAGAAGITVANAPVDRKQDYIEMVGQLADVFQLAQVTLLLLSGVDEDTKFRAENAAPRIVVGQETGIPVVQVAGMEKTLSGDFNYPRNAAVRASGSR